MIYGKYRYILINESGDDMIISSAVLVDAVGEYDNRPRTGSRQVPLTFESDSTNSSPNEFIDRCRPHEHSFFTSISMLKRPSRCCLLHLVSWINGNERPLFP